MKTTLDIPRELLQRAMAVAQAKTKTAAVRMGLESLVEREHIAKLLDMRGKLKLKLDLKSSRRR